MAFDIQDFQKVSSGAGDAPILWSYRSDDSLATIGASGYFDSVVNLLGTGDMLYIVGVDGVQKRTISSIINILPTITNGFIFSAQVQTGDIANSAVTAAKIAAAVAGAGLTGGAGTALAVQVDSVGVEINVDTLRLKASGVSAANIALNIPRTASVLLSSAEWIAMYATPKLLVAAPGANKLLLVRDVRYEFDYSSVQYTTGGSVAVQYDSTANGAGRLASATIANTVFNGYTVDSTVGAAGALQTGASSATVNKGLYLSNDTAAFAAGNSPVHVHVTYETVTTTI